MFTDEGAFKAINQHKPFEEAKLGAVVSEAAKNSQRPQGTGECPWLRA
jgi:hypothetical protein